MTEPTASRTPKIPEDLKQRYEKLASYKPMAVAVTDIYVRDWQALIERIATLTEDLAAMTADRNLWREAHDEDCPNKAELEAVTHDCEEYKLSSDGYRKLRDVLRDELDDLQGRLWCALGQPMNVEYVKAVRDLKDDCDAWKIRHDAKEQMRLEDEATIADMQKRLDEAPAQVEQWKAQSNDQTTIINEQANTIQRLSAKQ